MTVLKQGLSMLIGFSSGMIVAGGIFAFIAVIGIVPRLAQRTKTEAYIPLYEDAIVLGGVFGASTFFIHYSIPIGAAAVCFLSFCIGIFIGCLAVSLAEVLNVVPVFMRRARLTKGLPLFITVLALGKLFGSLIYFFVPGFYS